MSITAIVTASGTSFIPSRLLAGKAEAPPACEAIRRVKVAHPELGAPITVEVADLGDPYGHVARWGAGTDADNRPRHHFYRYDADRGALGATFGTPGGGAPPCEVAAFEALRKGFGTTLLGFDRPLDVADPLRDEVRRFETEYPAVATALIDGGFLADPMSHTPIPPGYPNGLWLLKPPFPTPGANLVKALERFSDRDFGSYGTPAREALDPLVEWSARIQPRRVRNAIAAATGSGILVGAYSARTVRRTPGRLFVVARLREGNVLSVLVGYWSGSMTPFGALPGMPADPDDDLAATA